MLRMMGIPRHEFWSVSSQTYRAPTSSKDGDIAYKPSSFRAAKAAWPTLVFEVGVSESLRGLRFDVRWWLWESRGDVKIVILVHVNRERKRVHIEKWELAPATRANPNPPPGVPPPAIPTKTNEVTITPVTIIPNTIVGPPFNTTGASLVLEFHKLLLRPAIPPAEIDVTLTRQDFEDFAAYF
jgi:hypothetical protein